MTANNLVGKNHPHLFHLSAEDCIQKSLRENMAGEYMELNSRSTKDGMCQIENTHTLSHMHTPECGITVIEVIVIES